MEVSGLMGQMPSRLGYQPTMGTELSQLEERIANTIPAPSRSRRCMCRRTISPIRQRCTFSHLSASIVLSRKRAAKVFIINQPAAIQFQIVRRHHRQALRPCAESGARSRNTPT